MIIGQVLERGGSLIKQVYRNYQEYEVPISLNVVEAHWICFRTVVEMRGNRSS